MGHYSYYLKCRLQELGYPALSLELYECSGFVQGSGVAWYGRLAAMDLHALARRMIREQARSPYDSAYARLVGRKEGKRLLELLTFMDTLKSDAVEIYTKGEKGGDHHAYSMGIDDQLDWDHVSAMTTQGPGVLEIYQRQWQRLIEWLQDDLERSSLAIDSELRNIKLSEGDEGTVVWVRHTARFKVEVIKTRIADFDLEYEEGESVMDLLTEVAKGQKELFGLSAYVETLDTKLELAGVHSAPFTRSLTDRFFDGVLSDVVYEAIGEARDVLKELEAAEAA